MISQETKNKIRKESLVAIDNRYHGEAKDFEWVEFQDGYIAGAEAEALRSHELIEAYNDLCALMNDELNTMEKHAKGYNTSRETIYKVIELQEKIKALNNYNKTDK